MKIKDQNQPKKRDRDKKKPYEIQIPFSIKINKNDFKSLIQDIDKNLNNNALKTTVDKKTYDLKNEKKFLVKITNQKISEKDAKELYSDLITPDIIELKNTKGKGKKKRENILNVLGNLEPIYNSGYLHYKNKSSESELESEESIAEKTKLRRQRSAEQLNE